jgi:hypothetical protein
MTFDEVLSQVQDLLQREQRVSYRGLKRRFALDDEYLEDLKEELIGAKRLATDEEGRFLVWTGAAGSLCLLSDTERVADGAGGSGAAPEPSPTPARSGSLIMVPRAAGADFALLWRVCLGARAVGAGPRPLPLPEAPLPDLWALDGVWPVRGGPDLVVPWLSGPGPKEESGGASLSSGAATPFWSDAFLTLEFDAP